MMNLLQTLSLTGVTTVTMQLSFFAIAAWFKFDLVTDLAGTMNFLVLAWLVYGLQGTFYLRQSLVSLCVTLWAVRLGSFLLFRVITRGHDARFDRIRQHFFKFLIFWVFQMTWVWTVSLPVTITNAATVDVALSTRDYVGLALWLVGFVVQAVADHQKFKLTQSRSNSSQFPAQPGLWAFSRHPNYFGEIMMWLGLFFVSRSVCPANHFRYGILLGAVSPLWTFLLLAFLSGIPLAEARSDKTYGDSSEYRHYKLTTSPLVPLPPGFYSKLPFAVRRLLLFEFPIYWKHFKDG